MKLASGQVAFEMDSEESGLRVEVQMPETLITRVQQGSKVAVAFPSIGTGVDDGQIATTKAVVTEVGTPGQHGQRLPGAGQPARCAEGLRPG